MKIPFSLRTVLLSMICLAMTCGIPLKALAESQFNSAVQVSANPGDDFAPALSPDGSMMAYVSGQSGNLDIWLKLLGPGSQPPDRQLTFHSADDNSPAFSPDGKRLVFISNRSDPKGDVYIMDLGSAQSASVSKKNKLLGLVGLGDKEEKRDQAALGKLTDEQTADSEPVWSPDGQFIYFAANTALSGENRVVKQAVGGKTATPVVQIDSVSPSISPDGKYLTFTSTFKDPTGGLWIHELATGKNTQITAGPEIDLTPRWSQDGRFIYFTRYQDDVNFDGQLTIDDPGNIWRVEMRGTLPGKFRQLTDSSTYDLLPVAGVDHVFFTTTRKTGVDIWRIPLDGMAPLQSDLGQGIQFAEDLCPQFDVSYPCQLIFENMIYDFAGEELLVRTRYRAASGYKNLGHRNAARKHFEALIQFHGQNRIYKGLAQIELMLLAAADYQDEGATRLAEENKKALTELEKIIVIYQDRPEVVARGLVEKGHIYFDLNQPVRALNNYKEVVEKYSSQRWASAEAAFSMSKIYVSLNEREKLVDAFVQVTRNYYDVEFWTRKAVQEILALFEKQPTLKKKVFSLQNLEEKYKTLPLLAAAVRNRIGRLYHKAHENLLAKEAYRATMERYPKAPRERLKAMFALAGILAEEEDFQGSLNVYQKITEGTRERDEDYRRARAGYIRKSLEKGKWELKVGEVKLAVNTYKKLIDFDPKVVEAHRGYLQAKASLGEVNQTVKFYKDRTKVKDALPAEHYALGLAYTYLTPPNLKEAENEIDQALTADSLNPFYHQTLGYVYEQKENSGEKGSLERAVHEYQIALALNDEALRPRNEADLALNLGNGNYLLKNFNSAYLYYKKRLDRKIDFINPDREALYYRRFGESAFKSGLPDEAAEYYLKALALIEKKNDPKRLAEINDRIALAYQDGGHYAKAVDYFSKTLELHRQTGNTQSISKALRNIANNLYSLNENKKTQDVKSLNLALGNYFKAVDNLEKYGLGTKAAKEKTGLIDVSVETSLDDKASQAASGFDKTGEEKLIFNYIGKIYGDLGDYERAIDYYQKKLDLIPEIPDPKANVPVALERAILLNQIGNYHFHSAHLEEGKRYFLESYALSKAIDNRQGVAVNAANLGRILLARARTRSLEQLKEEMDEATELLEESAGIVQQAENFANPEYEAFLKNYLGILYHYRAVYSESAQKAPAAKGDSAKGDSAKKLLQAAYGDLETEYGYIKKSRNYFEQALALTRDKLKNPLRQKLESALLQNLELTDSLTGRTERKEDAPALSDSIVINSKWQFRFLEYFEAEGEAKAAALLAAEEDLSRLPFGMLPAAAPSRTMMEELYLSLVRYYFEHKQYSRALHYSEKGLQQILVSLNQDRTLHFNQPAREELWTALAEFAEAARKLSLAPNSGSQSEKSEKSEKMEDALLEYFDFLQVVREEDPALASLFSPTVPELERVREFLKPGEIVLKYQIVYDRIFIWALTAERVLGGTVESKGRVLKLAVDLNRSGKSASPDDLKFLSESLIQPIASTLTGAKSVYLIANGALESLPWQAFKLEGALLIERFPIVFLSSLSQFVHSQENRNLYNSRFLALETPQTQFAKISKNFATAVRLAGDASSAENFQIQSAKFGVVQVDGKTNLGRLEPKTAYINLSASPDHFERLYLDKLLGESLEGNFIALNHVDFQADPESGISPAAPLIHSLDFMGFPGILLHFGAPDPALHEEFLESFYSNFRKGYPAESLRQAQMELARKYPGSQSWAQYRYYGFPGMDEEEKSRFANEHFLSNAKQGIAAFTGKNWGEAVNYFERALALLGLMEDQSQADQIYKALSQAAYNMKDYGKAVEYQKVLVARAKLADDPEVLAGAVYFLGILYSRAEQFPQSVENLQAALKIYKDNEILDKLADSYSVLGVVEENSLDYDKALEAFQASLAINQEIGEELNQGRELRRLGRIYYLRLNDYGKARNYFSEALNIFREIDQQDQWVEALLELGLVAEKQSDFGLAMKYYNQAEGQAREHNLKPSLSKALLYQANTSWFQGDYQNAFKYQRQALALADELQDKRQQAFIYNTLGLIHWTLNDSARALKHLHDSRDLADEAHSLLDVSSAYNNIGLVYRKDKKYSESLEYFQKALDLDVQLKTKWGQGYTHRNMGMSYLRMKNLDEAEGHIKKAIQLSAEIGNRTNLVKAKLELGNLHRARKDCAQAVPVYRETGRTAKELNIKEVHWRALRGEGFCLNLAGKTAEAVDAYKKAVTVVDNMRAAIKVEEFQNGFLTDKQDVYKELIILLLNQGKVEEAFNFAERGKSRSFIDLLGNQKISLKDDVSQKLFDRIVAQKNQIRKLEDSLGAVGDDEKAKELLKSQLAQARTAYQDLLIEAKAESPEISNFVTVESITLKELQKLLEEDVALAEYLVTEKELVAWVITRDGISSVRTPVTESDLSALVGNYRTRIQDSAPVESQSTQLYGLLITPIEKLISAKRILGIVPHGRLHYVSFASLKDDKGYLIEKHPLFYSPSASVLKFTFARKQKKQGKVRVLAMGNPDLKNLNYDLPLAELEAKSIRWDFPEIDIFTREKATESWIREHIADYNIIHIASHGEFDAVNPLFSSLKLASDKAEDGSLQVSEVFSLNIKADLVTLSACQTGLGEITGGDELVGLNRAFLYAGTHALLSSLWRVSDVSTAVLIKHFYRNYNRENKAESLREAQLLVKSLYPHPSYWSAFNLTGDYR